MGFTCPSSTMKSKLLPIALCGALASALQAGSPATSDKNPVSLPPSAEADFGQVTVGGKFSEDLQSGYLDVIQGLVVTDKNALFMNLRDTLDDSKQNLFSAGLGLRTLIEDPGVIIGGNVFYDNIDSPSGNTFNELGLGAEILSKWVDARFNYYLPESGRKYPSSRTSQSSVVRTGGLYTSGGFTQRDVFRETTTTVTRNFEQALQGWNAEIGFLVPGVEKYFDLRLFAGAYGYDNPGGGRYNGFKGRAEARVTRHLTLNLEYWEDRQLVGGNWVAGVAFHAPFDMGRLIQGQNPFKEEHPAPPSSLRSRMSEFVERSHRVMTGGSETQPGDTTTDTTTTTIGTTDQTPIPPPPQGGGDKPPQE